jgi:hypothetical protein
MSRTFERLIGANRWDEKAGLRRDALSSQVIDALEAHETRRPAVKKPSTTTMCGMRKLHDGQLTIGLDLGDRSSFYCVLNGVGEVILEAKVATNPQAMRQTFGKMPRSTIDGKQVAAAPMALVLALGDMRRLLSGESPTRTLLAPARLRIGFPDNPQAVREGLQTISGVKTFPRAGRRLRRSLPQFQRRNRQEDGIRY